MKMKLIILLLVILTTAIGQFCPEQKIHKIRTSLLTFKGSMNFIKQYDSDMFENVSFEEKSFDIENIINGMIIVKNTSATGTVDQSYYNYLAHNDVVCHTDSKSAEKECLLQYLSIDFNTIFCKHLKFSYTPVAKFQEDQDCERFLRDELNKGLTCRIENIEKENQVFIIPLSENKGDEIYFYTGTNEFSINESGKRYKAESFEIKEGDDSVTLILDTQYTVNFPQTNSCYALLIKISSILPHECPKDTFDYFYLHVFTKKNEPVDISGVPKGGKLKLKSRDDIEFTNGPITKQLNFNKIIRAEVHETFLPKYEKVLWVVVQNKETGYRYRFFVYYWKEECEKYIKSLLKLKNKTCPKNENTLYYYSINAKGNKLKQGKLIFNNDNKVLTVKNDNYLVSEKKILVINLKLSKDPSELEKLIINGLLLEKGLVGEAITKTYLVDIYSDNICLKRFNKIKEQFSEKEDSENNISLETEDITDKVITQGERNSKSFISKGVTTKGYDNVFRNPPYVKR
jgi:hypothetical protein